MTAIADALKDLVQTALRMFPWPTECGLRRIGEPGPESPVLVTGNYDLTVRRVERALADTSAWLVVAPSRGINVWCAAAGGMLGTSQVVSALKTCGVESHVRHRRAILPQLAATGVVAHDVSRRCGWKVRFGPVRAEDLRAYLAANGEKDERMRRVRYGTRERWEMALAWAFPMSVVFAAVLAPFRPGWILPVTALAAAMSASCFFLYDRLGAWRWVKMWLAWSVLAAVAAAMAGGHGSTITAAVVTAGIVLTVLTFDYDGSTPVEGGSHFDSRRWRITLDADRCVGVWSCWAVCPEACFEKRADVRKVELAHDDRCIKCGACVVQCPEDALFFVDEAGRSIPPDGIRRHKLDMLGKRRVRPDEAGENVD